MARKLFQSLPNQKREPDCPRLDSSGESFEIRQEGSAPTVLCIHGFTGVPAEVALGCEAASELGLAVHAPLLAGHGTTPADLAPLRFSDWVDGVRPHFLEARRRGPVVLVGLSLGSLIATVLTLEAPGDVAGLVLMANAFWLQHPHPNVSLKMADRLGLRDFYIMKSGPDLSDLDARESHISYKAQPLHAAISLRNAGASLREELYRINRPTLLLHGAQDHVTPVSNAWRAAERLGTRDSKVIVYPRSRHILPRDVDRERVKVDLANFFRRIAGAGLK